MPTYRLDLEYEGTRYHGWQEQKNARGVANELRSAIEASGASIVELGGSGRTDAGVHALRQTAHLRLRSAVEPERLRFAINDALPPDLHVLGLWRAAERFHARHDAVARSYLYQIARRRTALGKRFVWWIKRPLDAGRLAAAAALLEGRHDFRAFCERPAEQPSTVVVVERVEVSEAGDLILVRLVASHFLWKMVRRSVGLLVAIGAGEFDRGALEAMLAGEGGEIAARLTAPPSGLFLERVVYPGEPPLGPLAPAMPVAAACPDPAPPYLGRGAVSRSSRRPSARSRSGSAGG